MKAGYTGVDIDLHRIHSGDDMDKCKIYSAVDRGVVRRYTAGKSVTNWGSGASRRRILVECSEDRQLNSRGHSPLSWVVRVRGVPSAGRSRGGGSTPTLLDVACGSS